MRPGHYVEFNLSPSPSGWLVRVKTRNRRRDMAGAFFQESFLFATKKAAVRFITPLYRGTRR